MAKPRKRRRRGEPWWAALPTEELLDVRLCDLGLRLEDSAAAPRVARLHDELAKKGLAFRPYVWFSTDWFTPEHCTGFAIPFYLGHPRLVRLEHAQMFEAEGSTREHCMQLLRHEAAHAIDNAYLLHWRQDWRRTFGRYSAPYRADYHVNPTSRDYVQNLPQWYAQSHPAEDWAETFAVWLAPNSKWATAYDGWPALKKLAKVDFLMRDIGDQPPEVRSRDRDQSLPGLRMTLREHYRRRKAAYRVEQPWRFDRELRTLFGSESEPARGPRAAALVGAMRQGLRAKVSDLTGAHRYVVDEAIDAVQQRCRELDLRVGRARQRAQLGAAVLLTMVTLSLTKGGRPRFRR